MRGAVVTGGSSGIGLALASRLAAAGVPVLLVARGMERLSQARARLQGCHPGVDIAVATADVADPEQVDAAVNRARDRFGGLSWSVACAGLARPGLFLDQDLSDHVEQMQVNYFGSLHLARAAAPAMAEGGGGRLVFVASGAALFGIFGYSAYSPSKFAVRGLAECLRVELRASRVSVTLAYPPDTDTPQLAEEEKTKPAATRRITAGGGRWQAEDVARGIFAAASRGRFISTQGVGLGLVARSHSLIAPALRARQYRVLARAAADTHSAGC